MWAPGKIPAGQVLHEMMSHMDVWPTTAAMVGLKPPAKGEMKDNNGKPIYFDGIDNTAYVTGKAKHSARNEWIYIDGENFAGARADIALDPEAPDVKMAWKALYTSKDTWMGPTLNMGAVPSLYNLTMDPYEKYDMMFNGAVATRNPTSSPGRYAGMDNGWAISLMDIPLIEFNKSIVKYPNIKRFPGGASNDMIPNLQNPKTRCPTIRSRCRRPSERGAARQRRTGPICVGPHRLHRVWPTRRAVSSRCGPFAFTVEATKSTKRDTTMNFMSRHLIQQIPPHTQNQLTTTNKNETKHEL